MSLISYYYYVIILCYYKCAEIFNEIIFLNNSWYNIENSSI